MAKMPCSKSHLDEEVEEQRDESESADYCGDDGVERRRRCMEDSFKSAVGATDVLGQAPGTKVRSALRGSARYCRKSQGNWLPVAQSSFPPGMYPETTGISETSTLSEEGREYRSQLLGGTARSPCGFCTKDRRAGRANRR
jgi:hypothetical protein